MTIGPIKVAFVDSEVSFPLVDGRFLFVAFFAVAGPDLSDAKCTTRPFPAIMLPIFDGEGRCHPRVVVVRQHDFALNAFLLFHELLHAVVELAHLPRRVHRWVDAVVRHQVLDTPWPLT